MVKLLTRAGKNTGRLLALTTLTATLVACGGGSGDTEPDFDGDGIPDSEETDADDDGVLDSVQSFLDLNRNGVDDRIDQADFDNDGLANIDDPDADGDGTPDVEDLFVDLDGDGLDDITGAAAPTEFVAPSANAPCGSESRTDADADSSTADWSDNCLVTRRGQWTDSLLSVGIQRVVFCAGFGGTAGQSYADFADGEFGPGTEAAVKQFQANSPNPLTDDGEVGEQTWAKLEDAITRLATGDLQPDGSAQDSYGFTEGRCANEVLFYQTVTTDPDTQFSVGGGWRLAKNPPNTADSVPFSIESPFNKL